MFLNILFSVKCFVDQCCFFFFCRLHCLFCLRFTASDYPLVSNIQPFLSLTALHKYKWMFISYWRLFYRLLKKVNQLLSVMLSITLLNKVHRLLPAMLSITLLNKVHRLLPAMLSITLLKISFQLLSVMLSIILLIKPFIGYCRLCCVIDFITQKSLSVTTGCVINYITQNCLSFRKFESWQSINSSCVFGRHNYLLLFRKKPIILLGLHLSQPTAL